MEQKTVVSPEMAGWIFDRYQVFSLTKEKQIVRAVANEGVKQLIDSARVVFIGDRHDLLNHRQWRQKIIGELWQDGDEVRLEGGPRIAKQFAQDYPPHIREKM